MFWQLLDIAYVTPAAVFLAYFIALYVQNHYQKDIMVVSIILGAALGLILTGVKIKRFVDYQNNKTKK
jgi:hypothetical protein